MQKSEIFWGGAFPPQMPFPLRRGTPFSDYTSLRLSGLDRPHHISKRGYTPVDMGVGVGRVSK